jgi:hypothetical protein
MESAKIPKLVATDQVPGGLPDPPAPTVAQFPEASSSAAGTGLHFCSNYRCPCHVGGTGAIPCAYCTAGFFIGSHARLSTWLHCSDTTCCSSSFLGFCTRAHRFDNSCCPRIVFGPRARCGTCADCASA